MIRFATAVITLIIAAVAVPVALGYTAADLQAEELIEVQYPGQYFRRWNSIAGVVCHNGEVNFRGMVMEWQMPHTAGSYAYTRFLNGAPLDGATSSLSGERTFSADTADSVRGATYPYTYRVQADTFIHGNKVYESAITVECNHQGPASAVFLTNTAITAPRVAVVP